MVSISKRKSVFSRHLAILIEAAILAPIAHGAVLYKDATTTDLTARTSWNTSAMGTSPTPDPLAFTSTDTWWFTEVFAGTSGSTTATMNANTSAGQIRYDSISGSSIGSVVIDGTGTLTLAGNADYVNSTYAGNEGIVLSSTTGGSLTLNTAVALAGDQNWISWRNLTVTGNITMAGYALNLWSLGGTQTIGTASTSLSNSGPVAKTLTTTADSAILIAATIDGAINLSRTGNGTLTLTNTNSSFTGTVSLVGGTTNVASLANKGVNSSLGAGTGVILLNGTTLNHTGSSNSTTNRSLQLVGGSNSVVQSNGSGTLTWTGDVAFSGSGARGLTLGGANTGINTFGGLIADGSGAVTTLTKSGAGTWTLTGANTYTGGTQITEGTLVLGHATNTLADASSVTVSGTGILHLGVNSDTVNAVTISGGSITGTGTLTVASLTATNSSFASIAANLAGTTNSSSFIYNGTGKLIFTGIGSYKGSTRIDALNGTLRVSGNGVLGGTAGQSSDNGNIWFTGNQANGALEFETAANLGVASQFRFRNTSGGSAVAGTGGLLLYVGTTLQTVSQNFQSNSSVGVRLESNSVSGSVNFAGTWTAVNGSRGLYLGGTGTSDNKVSNLISIGVNSVTKRDSGKWILSHVANAYIGATTLEGGILGIVKLANGNADSSLGASSNNAANLIFSGGSLVYLGLGGDSTDRAFTVSGSGFSLSNEGSGSINWTGGTTIFTLSDTAYGFTLGGSNAADNVFGTTLSNNGTGVISLSKQGAGTWSVIGSNNYTGGTMLNAGTLRIGNNAAFGSGTLILNGGALSASDATSRVIANNILFGGDVTLGDFSKNGQLTFNGTVNLGGAVRTLTVSSSVTLTGLLSGSGLTKAGSDVLTLAANNSGYTGTISVQSGTLLAGRADAFGQSVVTLSSGGTLNLAGLAVSNNIANTGGVLSNYAQWSGAFVIQSPGVSGSVMDAMLTTYGRTSITVISGGQFDLTGFTKQVIIDGGSLTGGLSAYTGEMTVRSAVSFTVASPAGKVILEGGTIAFGNRTASGTIDYRSGSLTGAALYTGDIRIDTALATLAPSSLGGGRVLVGTGTSVSIGAGFSNAIRLEGGSLVGNTLNNYSGVLTVASGRTFDLDGATGELTTLNAQAAITLESTSILQGNGSVGALTVESGGILSPGDVSGKITATSVTLQGGGLMQFEVARLLDFTSGPAVAGEGYDTVHVTGVLDLSSLSSVSRFQLNLYSYALTNSDKNAAFAWDSSKDVSFVLFSYGTLSLGDNLNITSLFNINSDGFYGYEQTKILESNFSIYNDSVNQQLRLNYSAIPEPSAYGIFLGGLALAATSIRRMKKQLVS